MSFGGLRWALCLQTLEACGIQWRWQRLRSDKPFGWAFPTRLADGYPALGIHTGINERRVEDEYDLVHRPPPILKPVFDYPGLDHVLNFTTKLLSNLAMQCFLRRLAELYSTAERPKELLVLHVALARSDEDAIPVTEDADGNMSYGCRGGVLLFVRGGLMSKLRAAPLAARPLERSVRGCGWQLKPAK
jgi:hypothetical protein